METMDSKTVKEYVNDSSKDKTHRRGLLKAWNTGMKGGYVIKMPDELKPTVVASFTDAFNFQDYDSEEEDDSMDIGQTKTTRSSRQITLRRGKKNNVKEVKALVFSLVPAVRIGRQIVKRNVYKQHLPIVVQSGDNLVEFHRPSKSDIYAFPLKKVTEGDKTFYQRAGNLKTFDWKNLAKDLDKEVPEENKKAERATKRRRIFDSFRGKEYQEMTSGEFAAVCAIGSDWMKGSGNKTFVEQVAAGYEEDLPFSSIFDGDSPKYVPASSGGRSKVTAETKNLKSKKRKRGESETD